jgi:DNA-binding PadR family transcriptional regulator
MGAQPSAPVAATSLPETSLPEMSLPEWLVLAILSQQPAHGFAVAQLTAPGGDLGRVWQLPKAVVYRAIGRLHDAGLIAPEVTEPGLGPQRTVYAATPSGHEAAGRWLRTPVEHVREIRSQLLLKLALLDRAGQDPSGLLRAQRAVLEPIAAAIEASQARSTGFDATLLAWRRATAVAALDFLDRIAPAEPRLAPLPRGQRRCPAVSAVAPRSAPPREGEEALRRVIVGGQLPAGGRGAGTQHRLREQFVGGEGTAMPGGERGSPGRVEEHQQPAGAGHPGELMQPGHAVREMVNQARGEDRVGRSVGEWQRAGVGEDQHGLRADALRPGGGQHLGGQVNREDRSAGSDRLP